MKNYAAARYPLVAFPLFAKATGQSELASSD